jgi:hypothetical protein
VKANITRNNDHHSSAHSHNIEVKKKQQQREIGLKQTYNFTNVQSNQQRANDTNHYQQSNHSGLYAQRYDTTPITSSQPQNNTYVKAINQYSSSIDLITGIWC